MKKTVKKWWLWGMVIGIVPVFLLLGCATIIHGGMEKIRVSSKPEGAKVVLVDLVDNTEVEVGTTPVTVEIDKGKGFFTKPQYKLVISKEGYKPKEVMLKASVDGWYVAGNFFCFHLLGWLLIDPISGAMWNLSPNKVDVQLAEDSSAMAFTIVLVDQVDPELLKKAEYIGTIE